MLWLIPLLPLAFSSLLLLWRPRARSLHAALACTASLSALTLVVVAAEENWAGSLVWSDQITLMLQGGVLPLSMAGLVFTIATAVMLYAAFHEEREGMTRLMSLLLVFIGGMSLLVLAADFVTLLIGWEIVGACSWALIAHDLSKKQNAADGLHAFIVTRFGDLGLFLAAMTVYSATGSFSFSALGALQPASLQIVAFGILLSAAAKAGQVPFSPWLFRAMAGPTSVSALLHAATMVAAGAWILIRLNEPLSEAPGFATTTMAVGLITALSGGIVAVLQPHAKKLLAASTSAHYGLMFVAVGAGFPAAAFLHLIVHAFFKAALFLSAGIAGKAVGDYGLRHMLLGNALPFSATLTLVATASLAGIPPLAGGWTKESITAAAEHQGLWWAIGVMLAGALSAAYATRFQLLAFGAREVPPGLRRPGPREQVAPILLAIGALGFSALWIPSVHKGAGRLFGMEVPTSSTPALIASLLLVAAGLLAGRYLASRQPALGNLGASAKAAGWLGLPLVLDTLVRRPFTRFATLAAELDDNVIDLLPRAVGRTGRRLACFVATGDNKAVDAGIEASVVATQWMARIGSRFGELASDGFPEGTGRLVGISGNDVRRLQTGLSHHYYVLLSAGGAITILLLIFLT